MVVGIGVVFSLLLTFGGHALVTPFLDGDGASIDLGASYLLWMGPFYFLSFIGHSYVGHYRGIGRMNVTFIGTTLQIAVRVIGTYALVGLLGLNAPWLPAWAGWSSSCSTPPSSSWNSKGSATASPPGTKHKNTARTFWVRAVLLYSIWL